MHAPTHETSGAFAANRTAEYVCTRCATRLTRCGVAGSRSIQCKMQLPGIAVDVDAGEVPRRREADDEIRDVRLRRGRIRESHELRVLQEDAELVAQAHREIEVRAPDLARVL